MEWSTYGALHIGDVMRGADDGNWTVVEILHVPEFSVTLKRDGETISGAPAPDEPVWVVKRADASAEYAAAAALIAGFGGIEILGERWN